MTVSGTQHVIEHGDVVAVIASVGASLRSLTHAGRDLVVPFDADEVRPLFRGATLAPWPNRVVDGRYPLDGAEQQLALTEPDRGHALHGLVAWLDFAVLEARADAVTLSATIPAQIGYPRTLRVDVAYVVDAAGLHERVTATNLGTAPAPYGVAPHPYLVAGPGRVDDWTLELPAARVLTVTPDRLAPLELVDVDDAFDFRQPRQIGDTFVDHAFTGLGRDADGGCVVRLTTATGEGVEMRFGTELDWVQIHTADRPGAAYDRAGLAVEPMTCAPDAFNSGAGLIMLEPGAEHVAAWQIGPIVV